MSPAPNADALIAEGEREKLAFAARMNEQPSWAYQVGWLQATVRRLCADIADLRSVAGITESIARLPSRHADLLTVLKATQERIEAEAVRIDRYGFDTVAEYLDEACAAMAEAGANDAEEARIEYAYAKAQDERAELRGCLLYRSGS